MGHRARLVPCRARYRNLRPRVVEAVFPDSLTGSACSHGQEQLQLLLQYASVYATTVVLLLLFYSRGHTSLC
jgi:hypothetical protein